MCMTFLPLLACALTKIKVVVNTHMAVAKRLLCAAFVDLLWPFGVSKAAVIDYSRAEI